MTSSASIGETMPSLFTSSGLFGLLEGTLTLLLPPGGVTGGSKFPRIGNPNSSPYWMKRSLPNGTGLKSMTGTPSIGSAWMRLVMGAPPETRMYHSAPSRGETPARFGTNRPRSSLPSRSVSAETGRLFGVGKPKRKVLSMEPLRP